MKKVTISLLSTMALCFLLLSCVQSTIREGSFYSKLYKVEETFNGHPVQTFYPQGSYSEEGIYTLEEYVIYVVYDNTYIFYLNPEEDRVEGIEDWKRTPVSRKSPSVPCTFLGEIDKMLAWECYLFTDDTKMSSCEQDDVFMGVPIYKDRKGYYYRFTDQGKAVELVCKKDSKGNWIYWDSLKAYYKYAGEYDPSLDI